MVHPWLSKKDILEFYIFLAGVSFVNLLTVPLINFTYIHVCMLFDKMKKITNSYNIKCFVYRLKFCSTSTLCIKSQLVLFCALKTDHFVKRNEIESYPSGYRLIIIMFMFSVFTKKFYNFYFSTFLFFYI